MANTHEVTVFIWRNGPVSHGRLQEPQGHAALKIQAPGADKGDYHYLSFYPSAPGVMPRSHRMAGRLGPGSIDALNQQVGNRNLFDTSDVSISDMTMQKRKPDVKYRFRNMNFAAMITVIQEMMADPSRGKPASRFIPQTNNCSNAVVSCLRAGVGSAVASSQTFSQVVSPPAWLPNDIEAVCERLHITGQYQSEKV